MRLRNALILMQLKRVEPAGLELLLRRIVDKNAVKVERDAQLRVILIVPPRRRGVAADMPSRLALCDRRAHVVNIC